MIGAFSLPFLLVEKKKESRVEFRRARGERWEERKGKEQSDPLRETRRWVVSCSNAGGKGGGGGGGQEVLC